MIRKILILVEVLLLSLIVLGGSRLSASVSGNRLPQNSVSGNQQPQTAESETSPAAEDQKTEEIENTENTENTGFSWENYTIIAHALGGVNGDVYLNSKESFLSSYEKGCRLFEVDLTQTADGVWVCRHSWNQPLGQWEGDGKQVLTLEEFISAPIYGTYTPMTLEDLFVLLKDYPDAYVMLDTKAYSIRNYRRTLEDYSDYISIAENAGAKEVLGQIIPEIYNEVMFSGTALMHQFPTYIYSLWKKYSGEELREIAAFCKEKGIPAATVSETYWTEQTQEIFDEQGIRVYVYTVNDLEKAEKYKEKGVAGLCTDSLFEEE